MSFIDFSPFHTPTGIGQALDPVADAISRWRQRRQQREMAQGEMAHRETMQNQNLAFQREVEDRRRGDAERRQTQTDARDQAHATVANVGARQKVIDRARDRFKNLDVPGAESEINNYAEVEPGTNRIMRGREAIPFEMQRPNLGPAPQQPTLEDATPKEPAYSDFHEQADEMNTNRAMASAVQGRNDAATKDFGDRRAAYDERARRAPLDTTVSIGGSTPQSIRDMRYGSAQAEAEDYRQYEAALSEQGSDPAVQRQVAQAGRLRPLVATGKRTADQAAGMVEKGIETEEQRDFTGGQGDLNRQNALDRQALANQRPRSTGPMGDTKEEQVRLSRLRMLEQGVERFQKNFKIPSDRQEASKLSMSLDNEKNTAVQRSLVYNGLARGLAGEKGPLSRDDVTRIQGQLAGKLGDFTNWWSELTTGQMGDAKLAVVSDAIRMVLRENEARTAEAKQAYRRGILGPASPYRAWGLEDYALDRADEIFGEGTSAEFTAVPPGAQNLPIEAGGLVGTGRKKAPKQTAKPAASAAAAAAEAPDARAARLEKLLEERGF